MTSASAPAPLPIAPPPLLMIEAPRSQACKLSGKQIQEPTEGMIDHGYAIRALKGEAPEIAWIFWTKSVQISQTFTAGAPESYLEAEGDGVKVWGYLKAPLVYAKAPFHISEGIELNSNHSLRVAGVESDGVLSLTASLPFVTTGGLTARKKCDEVQAQPATFKLKNPKGLARQSGVHGLRDGDALWVNTGRVEIKLEGPLVAQVFDRRRDRKQVLVNFDTGQLWGWTMDPPPGLVGMSARLGRGFARPSTSDTRACSSDVPLLAKLEDGRFVQFGVISAGTRINVFKSEGPWSQVVLPVSWLQGSSFYVESSAISGCAKGG